MICANRCAWSVKFAIDQSFRSETCKVPEMPEVVSNVEFAQKVQEHARQHSLAPDHREQWIEMAEALVLAIVAVATAWSGYQAAKWDAQSSQHYNLASRTTVKSEEKATL